MTTTDSSQGTAAEAAELLRPQIVDVLVRLLADANAPEVPSAGIEGRLEAIIAQAWHLGHGVGVVDGMAGLREALDGTPRRVVERSAIVLRLPVSLVDGLRKVAGTHARSMNREAEVAIAEHVLHAAKHALEVERAR